MAENNSSERISQKLVSASAGNAKRKKKGVLIGVIVTCVVLALLGVIVYLIVVQGEGANGADTDKRNVIVTPDNIDEVLDDIKKDDQQVEQGYYTATMTSEWHFPKGNEPSSDAYVENVVTNTNDVYFDVVMEDDESNVVYKSPVIPRGSKLENVALDTDLDAGTYNCILIYHLIDDQQNTVSTLRMTIKIIIEG